MLFIIITIQWIFVIDSQIKAQNISNNETTSESYKYLRRRWPDIKFEDFYENSGEGPISVENITETYILTTIIIRQSKATVWPTITRVKVNTPKPKPIRVSSTPFFSCHKYWSKISYDLTTEQNSGDILRSILSRSSAIYSGPSSSISLKESTIGSDLSFSSLTSDLNSISLSSQSYIPSKSVITFDGLTSLSTKEFILSSSFDTNFKSDSMPRIESSFVIPTDSMSAIEMTPTIGLSHTIPLQSLTIETDDKNSISGSFLSFWRSEMISTVNPFITSLQFTSVLTASSVLTTFSLLTSTTALTTSSITKQTMFANKTINNKLQSNLQLYATTTPTAIPAPTPVPLGPECIQTQIPRESLGQPNENSLIRTVLNNTSNESMESIRERIVRNITDIYIYAFELQDKQRERSKRHTSKTSNARELLPKLNYTIEVKLYHISNSNGSTVPIDVIYYVKRDGILVTYEDAFRALSYISDDEYSARIGITVVEKIKPYLDVKVAKSDNWLSIILISCLALVVIIFFISMFLLFCKYRSDRRKWIDAIHSELNRVVPDNQTHWKTVSQHMDPNPTTSASTNVKEKTDDNSNEFEYLHFGSDKGHKRGKTKSVSKGTQSYLEVEKQKVISIPKLIDGSTDRTDSTVSTVSNEYITTTFVTTKEIETNSSEDNRIPTIIEVQMSSDTESIIRAIRKELNRFGQNSNTIPFIDDSQTDESIISNSSEA